MTQTFRLIAQIFFSPFRHTLGKHDATVCDHIGPHFSNLERHIPTIRYMLEASHVHKLEALTHNFFSERNHVKQLINKTGNHNKIPLRVNGRKIFMDESMINL